MAVSTETLPGATVQAGVPSPGRCGQNSRSSACAALASKVAATIVAVSAAPRVALTSQTAA
jgi:hypothetical protein